MEPSGPDIGKWETGWEKNPLDSKYFYIKRNILDSLGNEIGSINFEFDGYENTFSKPKHLVFGLSLKPINNNFINQFDLDSVDSRKIRDSLFKKRIGTGAMLPYNKFQLISADNIHITMDIKEFFLGYSKSQYRGFRLMGTGAFIPNTKIRIITGDPYFDKIIMQSFFLFKTKKIVNIGTHIN
ncbi:hypothetical protein GCM10022392_32570 [Mucilaginibacter panaciglaebae]|uniref:Uncharacterized protein n=1 Tax=Mucilaginibacter panaciglaebae TaxID=502331 RepID=A0ABP7X4F8_9SPHI